MQEFCSISSIEYFRNKILKPMLTFDLIKMTIPDKPNSGKQKYLRVKMAKCPLKKKKTDSIEPSGNFGRSALTVLFIKVSNISGLRVVRSSICYKYHEKKKAYPTKLKITRYFMPLTELKIDVVE